MKINSTEIPAGSWHKQEAQEEWEAPDPVVVNENTPEWDRPKDYDKKTFESKVIQKREAVTYPELVRGYSLFKDYFNPKDDVVYYPCCGEDISPSSVFQKSRIIYVDFNDKTVEQVKGLEFHNASALEFDPGDVDVLILQNPQIPPAIPCSHIIEGGYVLSNNYHSTASRINEDNNYELRAIIKRDDDNRAFIDTENLDDWTGPTSDMFVFQKHSK